MALNHKTVLSWKYPGIYWCKECHRIMCYIQAHLLDDCKHGKSVNTITDDKFRRLE